MNSPRIEEGIFEGFTSIGISLLPDGDEENTIDRFL